MKASFIFIFYHYHEATIIHFSFTVDESTSMNPRLIFLLTFIVAVVIVVIAFLIRIKYHNKRVLHRKRSIISERYDHLPIESKELKKPITYKELKSTDTEGSDTVFD